MISAADLSLGTKQAASIYFKNRVRRSWQPSKRALEQYPAISESDRTATKENILAAIYASSQAIKLQLTECLGVILKHDFPEKWPQFTVHLKELLHAQDAQRVYTGLLALLELIKRYRYNSTNREVVNEIAKELFPQVQKIAEQAIASDDELAMRMVWLSFKSYLNTIQSGLPVSLQEPANLVAWGTAFIKMIEKPVAFDTATIDDDAAKEPVWKAKKWAVRSVNRLYGRYGNPALLPSGNAKKHGAFAKLFTANFMPQILQVYLQQIEGYTAGHVWMSTRVRGLVAQFLSDCIKEKSAWKLLKPHTEAIVAHFIFPQLCFTKADQELWEDNPVEYVQKRIDPLDDFGSATAAASNLLIDFAFERRSATLNTILAFVNGVLTSYLQSSEEARDPRSKDGALSMLTSLCGALVSKKSPVSKSLPDILLTHVVPEFKSKYGFLRARALDTYCRYSGVEFPDKQIGRNVFEHVFNLLQDPELPVRVHAALALEPMIENEENRDALAAHLPQVMQVFLNLTNEIDSDTITHVIEEFVEVFADRMAPFAVELAQQLRDTFMRIMGDVVTNQPELTSANIDDISDKSMAAMGVLKTMGTLVLNLEGTPEVVFRLEDVVYPIVHFVLENRVIDLYDEVFEILDCCLFAMKKVTPAGWALFGAIYSSFKNDGIDFIEEMLPSLDNYVSYGMDVVATNTDVQARLFDIIESVMKSDRVGENECICACKLAETIMLQGRGKVDGMIPGLISLAAAYLLVDDAIKTTPFLVHALEVVLNALYYNPVITLNVLEQYKWTDGIFTRMVQSASKFTRVHDKKLMIVGLTAVLSVPAAQLPPSLQNGLPQLFETVLLVFQTLGKAIEARDAWLCDNDDDEFGSGVDWDGADEDFDLGDEADDDDNADEMQSAFIKELASQAAQALGSDHDELELNSNDDDDDDDDFGSPFDEEYSLESPLDQVDAYVHFEEKVAEMQNSNPAAYRAIVEHLSSENTQFVHSLLEQAAKQQELDSEKALQKVAKSKWEDEEESDSAPDEWDASSSEEESKPSVPAPQPKKKSMGERIAERQAERQAKKAAALEALEADSDSDQDGLTRKQRERQMQLESDRLVAEDLFAGLTIKDEGINSTLTTLVPKNQEEFNELQKALVERIEKSKSHRLYGSFLEKLVRELALSLKDSEVRKISSTLTALASEKQKAAKEALKGKKKNKKATVVTGAAKSQIDMNDYTREDDFDDFDDFM
ncbi:Nonsense-mediated mRNA decay protein 5 [Coemansia sp. RSA 990]|nr:Nonsense-mediated mRNA decay protein 5 [Coemansia sp. RSA 990]